MSKRRSLTIIGIDPSAHAGGYCVDLGDRIVFGTASIDEIGLIQFANWDADTVAVCIECPRRMYRGSNHVVRLAAHIWMEKIRSAFPRRNVPVGSKTGFVDPEVWRKAILSNAPGADWKEKALWYCQITMPQITEHNQAEAYCIMNFAHQAYRLHAANKLQIARMRRAERRWKSSSRQKRHDI